MTRQALLWLRYFQYVRWNRAAIAEAKKFDTDHNGKITGTEVMAVNAEMKSNANSRLYLLDGNENHYLEESELAKVPLKPAAPKATPKPAAKPKAPAKTPPGAKPQR